MANTINPFSVPTNNTNLSSDASASSGDSPTGDYGLGDVLKGIGEADGFQNAVAKASQKMQNDDIINHAAKTARSNSKDYL